MLERHPSVHTFWNSNETVFENAWTEWEAAGGDNSIVLDHSLYAPKLREAIERSWANPNEETTVKDLWTEVFPGVFKAQ